ncbi:MAG: glycosyltransferase family 39 protein [Chloroflexi bacterium]|nr:glycosyltransferase family 39 protein [Chloroflexota bacterium]
MIARDQLLLFPMTAVLLLGFALGATQLNADLLWLDELYSLSNMGVFDHPFNLTEVVDSLAEHSQNHVPLYFFLGSGWARLVGWAPLPMRYLSLFFGLLLIAWTYRFGTDLFDRRVALLAAALLSTSGFVILYFHEIRMYTLLLCFTVVHSWLYWRLTSRESSRLWEWFFFVGTVSALLYTHVFSLFVFAGLGLRHLLFASRIRRWTGVFLAWICGALTFLPYLPHYLRGALAERTIPALQESSLNAAELATGLAHIVVNGLEVLWLPLLILAGLAFRKRSNANIGGLLTVWSGIILSLLVFNEILPLIDRLRYRFFLASMPFFVILCARILLAFGRPRLLTLPFLLVWIVGGLHIRGLGDSWAFAGRNSLFVDVPPLHQFAAALRAKTEEPELVVGFSRSKFVDWPLRHGYSLADYYFGVLLNRDHAFVLPGAAADAVERQIETIVAEHPYLLFVFDPAEQQEIFDRVAAAIDDDYNACDALAHTETLRVQRLVINVLACDRGYQPIHFENDVRILDKFGQYERARESIRLVTGWAVADEAQLQQYNVSFQIIAPDQRKVGQAGDRHLYDNILKWHSVEMSTADLPPGDYVAVVILYDRFSNAKVSGTDLISGESGEFLPVMRFTVAG